MVYQEQLFSLTGKVVLVTGASEGLGRHFAAVLARCGASVVCGARTVSKLDSLVKEITAVGGSAASHALDVTKADSVKKFCGFAVQRFGRIDALVNNAGVQG